MLPPPQQRDGLERGGSLESQYSTDGGRGCIPHPQSDLGLRPIWYQKEERVLSHILVCFLTYVLWKTLAQWMRRSSLGDAPRTVLEELAKIKSGDVVLPTGTKQGRCNGTIRLRCVTEPDEAQKVLLHRLGITLPRRLRRIDEIVQM
jgi:hypothetical protein